MKKKAILLLLLSCICVVVLGQNYNNIVNFHSKTKQTHGVKIKTNLPFANANHVVSLSIFGYSFGAVATYQMQLSWYIYFDKFHSPSLSSSGGTAPKVYLINESGKVVIFLDNKTDSQSFTISAFSQGFAEKPEYFEGWTVEDSAPSGTKQVEVPYKNVFGGNVGIGTEKPQAKLDVRGKILAHEVEVKVSTGADFVFDEDFKLQPLSEVEEFIKTNRHLPDVQSEKDMQENGLNVNEFQIKLLQKIEELTLYNIQQQKQIEEQNKRLENQEAEMKNMRESITNLKTIK